MSVQAAAYLNGRIADSGDANNALATATIDAPTGQKAIGTGVIVSYSAAPAAGDKTIVVKKDGVALFTIHWTPSANEGFAKVIPFPGTIPGVQDGVLSVELAAAGVAALGRVVLFYFLD